MGHDRPPHDPIRALLSARSWSPRTFWWMTPEDFVSGLLRSVATIAGWLYAALLASYAARAVAAAVAGRPIAWGKHVVVAATAACWYVGIVATDSDYAFTVTNVFLHGVPYLGLVFAYTRAAAREPVSQRGPAARLVGPPRDAWRALGGFLASLWAIAYVEELLWDRTLWHEHAWLFGGGDLGSAAGMIVPLLAVPQITHYVLDGVLWRRRSNPRLGRLW